MDSLTALSNGFRSRYLPYEALAEQLRRWAEAFPAFVRLESIGKTTEGRDLWLLTLGPEPDRIRPAVWVDGNMHATELTGSSVALAIAEDIIRLHATGEAPLPAHLVSLIREDVLVYVLPRMSPDGAERVLTEGRFVRSNVRDERSGRSHPYWRAGDVDGDGKALLMRRLDPAGDFVPCPDFENLLLPRRVEDPGPFYKLFPEGVIENWDGFTVPAPSMMSDMQTDLNRNFSSDWRAEPHQVGAGAFATSEPESRAVTEFAVRHPNIFAWMNLHTFGGCYIRPAGDKSDKQMDQSDLSLFRQLGEWADLHGGYPMVSGFEEFTYEPDKPLHGDLSNYAYVERGAIGFVVELWDFFKQAGLEVHRPFVMNYLRRTRQDVLTIAAWDREHNEGRVVGAWRPFSHPQLGDVEIGGYDPRVGIWNPPEGRLDEVCRAQASFLMRLLSIAPRVRLTELTVESLDDAGSASRVSVIVENLGYLPTYVLSSAKRLEHADPLVATLSLSDGLSLASGVVRVEVGHLEGWGGYDRPATQMFARSVGAPSRRRLEWVVRGHGELTVSVSCSRVGSVETRRSLGAREMA